MLKTFKERVAWQKGLQLCTCVYELTRSFPRDERFGRTAQLRRAAVSIPSNIAEGYGRGTTREYVHSLRNANGSVGELETQLLIAKELRKGEESARSQVLASLAECERGLAALIRSLEDKINP